MTRRRLRRPGAVAVSVIFAALAIAVLAIPREWWTSAFSRNAPPAPAATANLALVETTAR